MRNFFLPIKSEDEAFAVVKRMAAGRNFDVVVACATIFKARKLAKRVYESCGGSISKEETRSVVELGNNRFAFLGVGDGSRVLAMDKALIVVTENIGSEVLVRLDMPSPA